MGLTASPTHYLLYHNDIKGNTLQFQQHTSHYQQTLHSNSSLHQLPVLWMPKVSTFSLQHQNTPFEPAVELQEEPEMTVKENEISIIQRNANDLAENTRVKAKNAGTKMLRDQPNIQENQETLGKRATKKKIKNLA